MSGLAPTGGMVVDGMLVLVMVMAGCVVVQGLREQC